MIALPVLLLAVALGGAPGDLAGRWTLDQRASDPVDALLQAAGASYLERQAASNLTVTQDIRVEGAELVIVVDSLLMDSTERLPLDGQAQSRTSKKGEVMTVRTWIDGAAVVTSTEITGADGRVSRMEIRRVVEDGGRTLRQTLRYTPAGGATHTADRVFRRE